jgi:hypothetical protein
VRLRSLSKKLVSAALPRRIVTQIECRRSRNHQVQYLTDNGILDINRQYIERFGPIVRSGPFAGLRYPPEAIANRHVAPRLIGFYEQCLHPVIASVANTAYQHIVDVGCAEGYYAVSFALRYPKARVHAFDADARELALCRRMARLNDVRNVEFRSFCNPATLCALIQNRRCLVLSDCEGFEDKLFNLDVIAAASRTDVLIELHEDSCPGVTDRLVALLGRSHKTRLVRHEPPAPSVMPELVDSLGDHVAIHCLNEFRDHRQQWLWGASRNGSVL